MDPISLIIAGLSAGASEAGAAVAKDTVMEAYKRLRELVVRRFGGDPEKRRVLENFEADPARPVDELERTLAGSGLEHDVEALQAAQAVLAARDPEGAARGVYTIQAGRDVRGVVQGDHNTVTFQGEPSDTDS